MELCTYETHTDAIAQGSRPLWCRRSGWLLAVAVLVLRKRWRRLLARLGASRSRRERANDSILSCAVFCMLPRKE